MLVTSMKNTSWTNLLHIGRCGYDIAGMRCLHDMHMFEMAYLIPVGRATIVCGAVDTDNVAMFLKFMDWSCATCAEQLIHRILHPLVNFPSMLDVQMPWAVVDCIFDMIINGFIFHNVDLGIQTALPYVGMLVGAFNRADLLPYLPHFVHAYALAASATPMAFRLKRICGQHGRPIWDWLISNEMAINTVKMLEQKLQKNSDHFSIIRYVENDSMMRQWCKEINMQWQIDHDFCVHPFIPFMPI